VPVLHRLFTLLSMLSLLLCVGTCVLWARSYRAPWKAEFPLRDGSSETVSEWAWKIGSAGGELDIDPFDSFYSWNIGYWKLATLWLILPARAALLCIHRSNTDRKSHEHICGACGYDLRATPDRCPECGAVPKAAGVKA
jgi:hypothetical protein